MNSVLTFFILFSFGILPYAAGAQRDVDLFNVLRRNGAHSWNKDGISHVDVGGIVFPMPKIPPGGSLPPNHCSLFMFIEAYRFNPSHDGLNGVACSVDEGSYVCHFCLTEPPRVERLDANRNKFEEFSRHFDVLTIDDSNAARKMYEALQNFLPDYSTDCVGSNGRECRQINADQIHCTQKMNSPDLAADTKCYFIPFL